MLTLFAFIVAIGLLVFIHEFGHYWAARRCGVGVLTFSIGFGRPIYQWKRGLTTWQIALIPLGGYVKMLDESEGEVAPELRQFAFNTQHPAKKMAIAFAGPFANLLLASLIYAGLYAYGVVTLKPLIGTVAIESIAAKAGLRAGDVLQRVNGDAVQSWDQAQVSVFGAASQSELKLDVDTPQGERSMTLDLRSLSSEDFDQHILSRLGLSPYATTTQIAYVQEKGAAARAGLQVGDVALLLNQQPLASWLDFQRYIVQNPSQPFELQVRRGAQTLDLTITPDVIDKDGKKIGRIGVSPTNDAAWYQSMQQTIQLSPVQALLAGVEKTYDLSILTVKMFGKMLIGAISPKQISGPLGIAEFAGQSAAMGWVAYLQCLALISVSLGVLNLMPVPILDGGHLLYHGYELLTGRTIAVWLTVILQKIGIFLLLMLMALALFNDAQRFLFGLG
ncbi:RIP metalloprotease RseP [uncultured Deefgea sp.]|uniref:RIP metalloprotease RseP n=1 Tax=uncultured Deefgea sp. TaxID=1304914 RepID=UPI002613FA78|nr:RIP metalloprotease RseP [uncultured Deefgea sp.]